MYDLVRHVFLWKGFAMPLDMSTICTLLVGISFVLIIMMTWSFISFLNRDLVESAIVFGCLWLVSALLNLASVYVLCSLLDASPVFCAASLVVITLSAFAIYKFLCGNNSPRPTPHPGLREPACFMRALFVFRTFFVPIHF